ncbi:MAG TPA: cytochrome c3 family protein [Bryobacteraceae bacterium]|nr:cytochrome c3 family protein [Bryobacteraceae bacterium]
MTLALRALSLLAALAAAAFAAKDSCVECHSALPDNLQAPVTAMQTDVHRRSGFSCAACHGGNPAADDQQAAMDRSRGFVGRFPRTEVPRLCARCHSDAGLMHKYAPQQRVDQYAQYQTSVHGKRIASGDSAAAVCTDCHGAHGVLTVKDGRSPVHPLRLPATCARCHADPQHMAKYKIPTDQFAQYQESVHWEAVEKRGDLSAPTCASCHGNHGATPPGVRSVSAVCGTCHVLMEDLYNKSPHQPVFASMGVAGCTACHGSHAVLKTSVKMLVGPDAVCSGCHDADSKGGAAAARMSDSILRLATALERSEAILSKAVRSGMEVSEAILRENDARESLVKARVAVHAFDPAAVEKPVAEGLKIASETYLAGEQAMQERQRRRLGLGISLITIAVTVAGLWFAIKRLEAPARQKV